MVRVFRGAINTLKGILPMDQIKKKTVIMGPQCVPVFWCVPCISMYRTSTCLSIIDSVLDFVVPRLLSVIRVMAKTRIIFISLM